LFLRRLEAGSVNGVILTQTHPIGIQYQRPGCTPTSFEYVDMDVWSTIHLK
jgi:hypothetical protein